MSTPLVVMAALLPDLLIRAFRRMYVPEDHFAVQEYERRARGAGKRRTGGSGSKGADKQGVKSRSPMERDVEAGAGPALTVNAPPAKLEDFTGDDGGGDPYVVAPRRTSYKRESGMSKIPVEDLPGYLAHYEALQAEMASRGQNPALSSSPSNVRSLAVHSSVLTALERSQKQLRPFRG